MDTAATGKRMSWSGNEVRNSKVGFTVRNSESFSFPSVSHTHLLMLAKQRQSL